MRRRRLDPRTPKIILFGIWVIFVIAGFYYTVGDIRDMVRQSACSVSVNATAAEPQVSVTTTGKGSHKRTHTYYKPVFSYRYNGKTYTKEYVTSNSANRYPAGKEAELMIDPANPEVYIIVGDTSLRNDLLEHGIFFLLFGICLPALYIWYHRSNRFRALLHKEMSDPEKQFEAMEKRLQREIGRKD